MTAAWFQVGKLHGEVDHGREELVAKDRQLAAKQTSLSALETGMAEAKEEVQQLESRLKAAEALVSGDSVAVVEELELLAERMKIKDSEIVKLRKRISDLEDSAKGVSAAGSESGSVQSVRVRQLESALKQTEKEKEALKGELDSLQVLLRSLEEQSAQSVDLRRSRLGQALLDETDALMQLRADAKEKDAKLAKMDRELKGAVAEAKEVREVREQLAHSKQYITTLEETIRVNTELVDRLSEMVQEAESEKAEIEKAMHAQLQKAKEIANASHLEKQLQQSKLYAEKLEAELRKADESKSHLEGRLRAMESEKNSLMKEKAKLEIDFSKYKAQEHAAGDRSVTLQQRVESLAAELATSEGKLSASDKKLQAAEQQILSLKSSLEMEEATCKQIKELLKNEKKKVEDQGSKMEDLQVELMKARKGGADAQQTGEQLAALKLSAAKQEEKLKAEFAASLAEMEKRLAEKEAELKQSLASDAQHKKKTVELEARVPALQEEVAAHLKRIHDLETEIEETRATVAQERAKIRNELHAINQELDHVLKAELRQKDELIEKLQHHISVVIKKPHLGQSHPPAAVGQAHPKASPRSETDPSEQLRAQLGDANAKLGDATSKLGDATKEVADLKKEVDTLNACVRELQPVRDQLMAREAELKATRDEVESLRKGLTLEKQASQTKDDRLRKLSQQHVEALSLLAEKEGQSSEER